MASYEKSALDAYVSGDLVSLKAICTTECQKALAVATSDFPEIQKYLHDTLYFKALCSKLATSAATDGR